MNSTEYIRENIIRSVSSVKRDGTCHLYPEDLLRIANAYDYAESQGMVWGVWLTVLRTHLPGSVVGQLPEVQEQVSQALRRFCRARALMKPEFIWVRECSHHRLDHLHILTTIPDFFRAQVQEYVSSSLGFSNRGVVADKTRNPFTLVRYFAKQLDPDVATYDGRDWYCLRDYIGLDSDRSADQPLHARRSGVSHGVGPKAQAQAGFKRHTSVEDLREFFSGTRDNQKTAKRRGWDADRANSYDYLKRAHLVAANENDERLKDAA